ncbi:MAG: nitronate monooxygenase [Hyphomonadaceae bacterium]|nr:nitronate monooxygenase [Hyphomonadaceae bacterium]MBP9234243.1 nitronate monooxygenase [Hyphomonadaceae bacterium]
MWPTDRLQKLFEIEHPVIQAPMAGASTPAMAIAVANAGGMGSLGCAMLTAEQLRAAASEVAAGSSRAVNLNFFVHVEPDLARHDPGPMRAALAPYYAEAGLGDPPAPTPGAPAFNDEMLEVLLACAPKVASFHFGLPSAHAVEALKRIGTKLIGNATNVAEAKTLEAGGMDAIVAQGAEAGGHRGAFIGAPNENDMGTMALVPLIVDAVSVPVIAAGGIFDGRGVAAAMMLGASGAQIGSAFLRTPESSAPALHKQALAETPDNATKLTRLFSGRPARSIRNRLMQELSAHEGEAAPFPTQRAVIAPLAKAWAARGSADFMQLWSGQAGLRAEAAPSAQIFRRICGEALALLA